MGGTTSKDRWYIVVSLQELYTEETGHWFSEGDFYVTVKSGSGFRAKEHRFPQHGSIRMNKREQFKPDPAPTLFADIITTEKEQRKLIFMVKGRETFIDDEWLKTEILLPFVEQDTIEEQKSKDGKVIAKVRVKVVKNNAW